MSRRHVYERFIRVKILAGWGKKFELTMWERGRAGQARRRGRHLVDITGQSERNSRSLSSTPIICVSIWRNKVGFWRSLRPHATLGRRASKERECYHSGLGWYHSGLDLAPPPRWASQMQSHGQTGIGTWSTHSPTPIWDWIINTNFSIVAHCC